ncbi:hypothetical protein R1sor_015771 [Riccia sorocarpa]|uniref:Replitron HUH endonuclease domain-containing protein n=1 Tax=Riccia sorocarpa TaxID=122646 RepID=A0ABD3HD65_9MARC
MNTCNGVKSERDSGDDPKKVTRCSACSKNLIEARWRSIDQREDFYSVEPTYVTVEWLRKEADGIHVHSLGPLLFCKQTDQTVQLEDATGRIFTHWKWMCRRHGGEWEYRCSAIAIWSGKCCCSAALKNKDASKNLPATCLCRTLINREYCHICLARNSACKRRLTPTATSTNQVREEKVEATLSQDVCLCSTVFNSNGSCYCGYGKLSKKRSGDEEGGQKQNHTKTESGETSQQTAGEGETESQSEKKPECRLLQVSITMGIVGEDICTETFDALQVFIEKRAAVGLIALERGDATLQLHFQGVMAVESTSARQIKSDLHVAIGWDRCCPVGGSICVKLLTNKGVHTLVGMVRYCMKDQQELHFRMYCKNVSEKQMDEGRQRYLIFGACNYKNRVELSPYNLLTRAMQFRRYRARNPLSISFRSCLRQMLLSGQYYPGLRWLLSPKMSQDRAESVWRLATAPESTTLRDIDETFYGIKPSERYHTIHPMESILQHAREKEDAQETKDLEKQLQDLETRIHTMAVTGSGIKVENDKRIEQEHNSHGTRLQAVGKGPRDEDRTSGGSRPKHFSKKPLASLPTKSVTLAAVASTSTSKKLKRKAKSSSGIEPAIAWFDRAGEMKTTRIKSSQEPDVREQKNEIELGDYIPLVRDVEEEE